MPANDEGVNLTVLFKCVLRKHWQKFMHQ